MALDPLSDQVGLLGELATEALVVLLANHLLLQGGVALGHQLTYVAPFVGNVLQLQWLISVRYSNISKNFYNEIAYD